MEHRVKYLDLEPGSDPPAGFDLLEPKYDGHWARAEIRRGVCEIYTRTGTLRKRCEVDRRLPRMTLIGEYMYGTAWSTQNDPCTGPRRGQFWVFDIVPRWWQRPTLVERRKRLDRIFCRWFKKRGPRFPEWFDMIPATQFAKNETAKYVKDGMQFCEDMDYEGLVFKKSTGRFGEPHARMKRVHTADFVCEGFNPGKGKYEGVAGSILGSLYVDGVLKHVCSVGGLTDIQRRAFTDKPEKFIGRVFEATGKGRFDSGALRHGSFIRWRNDKRPEECTWSSV